LLVLQPHFRGTRTASMNYRVGRGVAVEAVKAKVASEFREQAKSLTFMGVDLGITDAICLAVDIPPEV
jgi:hypothetical protein